MLFPKFFSRLFALGAAAFLLPGNFSAADDSVPAAPSAPPVSGSPATSPVSSSTNPNDQAPADGLARVNAAIALYPQNATAYIVRGNIYVEKQSWDLAQKDYEKALQIDGTNVAARVNLAEMKFRRKQYDLARPEFAALQADKNVGDLAGYKVFLCDLFGSHEATARQELDTFNAAGENASYYFGNIAWDLAHHHPEEARGFLQSAENIYPSKKIRLYASNLMELGYLPLPAPAE